LNRFRSFTNPFPTLSAAFFPYKTLKEMMGKGTRGKEKTPIQAHLGTGLLSSSTITMLGNRLMLLSSLQKIIIHHNFAAAEMVMVSVEKKERRSSRSRNRSRNRRSRGEGRGGGGGGGGGGGED
jgi:hypothetical protein